MSLHEHNVFLYQTMEFLYVFIALEAASAEIILTFGAGLMRNNTELYIDTPKECPGSSPYMFI